MVQLKTLITSSILAFTMSIGGHFSETKPGASVSFGGDSGYGGGTDLIDYNFNLGNIIPFNGGGGRRPKKNKSYNNGGGGGKSYGSGGPINANFDIDQMLYLVNQERGRNGASPLQLNSELCEAAQMQSDYQASIQTMTHNGSGGSSPGDRVSQCGFNWSGVAENVAYNQQTVEEVVECWINSPPHHENMVNPQYTQLGAGMNNLYWTQTFAC